MRIDAVGGTTPEDEVLGPPEELEAQIGLLSAMGEPIPEEWLEALERHRELMA
jgi:hypothetical protein